MQVAQPLAREQRDLDRPQQLRTAEMRARGIHVMTPAPQLFGGHRVELPLHPKPLPPVQRRLLPQRTKQGRDVKAGSAHDDGNAVRGDGFADGGGGLVDPVCG